VGAISRVKQNFCFLVCLSGRSLRQEKKRKKKTTWFTTSRCNWLIPKKKKGLFKETFIIKFAEEENSIQIACQRVRLNIEKNGRRCFRTFAPSRLNFSFWQTSFLRAQASLTPSQREGNPGPLPKVWSAIKISFKDADVR